MQLTPHFHLDEFRCPCCNDVIQSAAQKLAEALEPARKLFGPIHIRSGYRCPRYNTTTKGAPFSQHLLGLAADITVAGDAARFELISALLKSGFKRLGIARLIVHADIGTPTSPVIWTYYQLVYQHNLPWKSWPWLLLALVAAAVITALQHQPWPREFQNAFQNARAVHQHHAMMLDVNRPTISGTQVQLWRDTHWELIKAPPRAAVSQEVERIFDLLEAQYHAQRNVETGR